MLKSKEIRGLIICLVALILVSWSKIIFTGSLKVDDNPLSTWHGVLVILVFAIALFTYGRIYFKFYKDAEQLNISHSQIKIWGYLHIVLASLMLPILSNDIFLYIAYGDISNMEVNVYTNENVLLESKWFYLVGNWKNSPYLYGPITLWIGKIANWIGGDSVWGVLIAFKIIWALIALFFLEIMSLTVKKLGDFILVVFTPIFWLQNIGGLHYDLIAALFLLIAVFFITQQKIVFSLVAIALACMCKIVFIIFIPYILVHYFMINWQRIQFKTLIYFFIGLVGFLGICIIAYWPFWSGIETITIPFQFLNTQEPSKSFSEVIGELLNLGFADTAPSQEMNSQVDSSTKIWWWKQCRIAFNIIGMILAIIVSILFMAKTRFKFYKNVLAEYWIKLSLVFFFFYSHIFNAWYLIALLPFLPLIGNNHRLKKYFIVVSVFSCLHMIFLNIGRDSIIYYLLPPIVFINICLFLWQFRRNFLTVESTMTIEA